ncbi:MULTISPECIES: serine hydrolase [Flavobacteriaceae]|uniref:serine hydrolase domain-containing protein n=1 Tax=Flavobacteriaceae TaxID=49546 RepID=UPI0014925624|nr:MULTISPECIES: serine hydrolase domain-containing protein [Allomuricauda]MDC6365809.1 serine hydrolase [Muricauda sp. AC10]
MNSFFFYIKNLFAAHQEVKSIEGLKGLERAEVQFHNLIASKKVPGMAVTILKKGKVVLQKGYGYADLEKRYRVHPRKTVFRIASISKCITGMALGKMVDEGLVDLDTSLYDYVPYFPTKKHDFTLRQLASHTAGVRGYRGKEFALNLPYSIRDGIKVFQEDPLLFEPGKGYLYNSFDFVLLSLAMQEASGVPFGVYVRENILNPLNMNGTFAPSKDENSFKGYLANFYTRIRTGFKTAIEVDNYYKLAGGGYLSTSNDIAKLGQAILERKLLKKETYDKLFTSQRINGKSTYYGLGFQVSQDKAARPFVGHVGNSVGAYTNFFVYPEEETVVSILINCTKPRVQEILDEILNAILDLSSS